MDIRSNGNDLYISHDPFVEGTPFEEWLNSYDHAFLIANVKEEGLEDRLSELFTSRNITQWSFLDQSFPFLVKGLKMNRTKTMVRISEFENAATALSLSPRPDWVWLDSFTGEYPTPEVIKALSTSGYKFMIVSPELQSRVPEEEVSRVKSLFATAVVSIDGVCTKAPELWIV